MEDVLRKIRHTTADSKAGVIRIMIGLIIFSTGVMKFSIPMLWAAWSGQLLGAGIPFYEFNLRFVPVVEIIVGLLLVIGFLSRLGSLVVIVMMTVAAYVHLTVHDPSLFPLQPDAPVIPLLLIAASAYIVWRGGGSWSSDSRYPRGL